MAHYLHLWDDWDSLDADDEDEEAEAVVGRRCRRIVKGNNITYIWMLIAKLHIYIFLALSFLLVTILPFTVFWFI